jgi:hypothetical protein
MDRIDDRPAAPRKSVRVEFETGQEQPRGRVDTGDGTWRPFWGWLELMQTIEDALANTDDSSTDAPAPGDG